MRRFGRVASVEESAAPKARPAQRKAVKRYYPGGAMFPTTHGAIPETMDFNFDCLENLLKAGNEVLFISKPHTACVRTLSERFSGCATRIPTMATCARASP